MSDYHTKGFVKSYISGEALFGFWNIVGKFLAVASSYIIVSFLSLYEFGVYQLVLAAYGFFANIIFKPLVGVVLNDLIRFSREGDKPRAKKLFVQYVKLKFCLAVVAFLIMLLGADIASVYYDQNVANFFRIISFLFLVDTGFNIIKLFLEVHLDFKVVASRPVWHRAVRIVFLIAFLQFIGFGIQEVLIVHVVSSFIAIFFVLPRFFHHWRTWVSGNVSKENILWNVVRGHGGWALAKPIITEFPEYIRPWLIKIFVGTEAVAVFNVALMMFEAVKSVLPVKTFSYLVPRELHDSKKTQRILTLSMKYFTVLSLLVACAGVGVAYISVPFLLPHYTSMLPYFTIMLGSVLVSAPVIIVGYFLIGMRKQKFIFYESAIQTIVILVLYVGTLPLIGILGLAIEPVISATIKLVGRATYLSRRDIGIRFELNQLCSFSSSDREFITRILRDGRSLASATFLSNIKRFF